MWVAIPVRAKVWLWLLLVAVLASATGCIAAGGRSEAGIDKIEVKDIVTNLADSRPRYVRVSLVLEYRHEGKKALEENQAQVRDAVLRVLRKKASEEMHASSSGELRQEILVAINRALQSDYVTGVYFSEFVVQ